MAVAVIMPRQGNTVESCIITKWNKQKGDTVAAGEVLAVIEAMKMETSVLALEDGVIDDIRVSAGDSVKHGELLMTLKK